MAGCRWEGVSNELSVLGLRGYKNAGLCAAVSRDRKAGGWPWRRLCEPCLAPGGGVSWVPRAPVMRTYGAQPAAVNHGVPVLF